MESSCHGLSAGLGIADGPRLILVGNPNVGKSVVFAYLTGRYARVSNYPGTTVDITYSQGRHDGKYIVIDTPGIYSLVPTSEDERVARDVLLEEGERTVLQVGDAKNLRRALLLTSQLAETGLPMVLDINMSDEAQRKGIEFDGERLAELLGIPVVSTIAVSNQGLAEVEKSLPHAATSSLWVEYPAEIEEAIRAIESRLPPCPSPGVLLP